LIQIYRIAIADRFEAIIADLIEISAQEAGSCPQRLNVLWSQI